MRGPTGLQDMRIRWVFGVLLAAGAGALAVVAVIASLQVLANFRNITTEASDNLEWSLAQLELENLGFTSAIEAALLAPDDDLERTRLRFDIFYNRVDTIAAAPAYQELTKMPEFEEALRRTQSFLSATVPLVDGPHNELRAALPDLQTSAAQLRKDTRTLALSGLSFLVKRADERRARIGNTLLRMATLAVLLVAALVSLLFHVLGIYRLTRDRGKALAEANARMNTILSTSLDGVVVASSDGKVLEFNEAAEKIFQFRLQDIRGLPILDLLAPESTRGAHWKVMQELLQDPSAANAKTSRLHMDAKRANGEIFPIEMSVQLAKEGDQVIFIGFLHDISERVAAQQELVTTRDRALASEKAKDSFVTVMSHEIRTPLNGILGNLSMLTDTELNAPQTRYVRNMAISGRVLMRHVDSVLDVARYESGKRPVKIACTDLSVLLQELTDSQSDSAKARGTSLTWSWEGPPRPLVRTDRAALEQVLLNLLGNAIKFTTDGRITIEAETVTEEIDGVSVIELRVIDTGIGIPATTTPHVFDDFVTSDTSFGRVAGGTGLGLGIARRIVTALGGEIGVETAEGEGSVFWVRLPMEAAIPRSKEETAAPSPLSMLRRLDILVVEDNAINLELTHDMLTREGHSVTTTSNGAESVRMAQDHAFDLILMDVAMPVMDGLQATQAIRNGTGACRDTPIIALSANILPKERTALVAAGMNGFLAKPLERSKLQTALQEVGASRPHTPQPSNAPPRQPSPTAVLDFVALSSSIDSLPAVTFNRLLDRFVQEGDALLTRLPELKSNPTGLAQHCHDSAGAAAVFGAQAFRETLVHIETCAKTDEFHALDAALQELPNLWTRTKKALSHHRPSNATPPEATT